MALRPFLYIPFSNTVPTGRSGPVCLRIQLFTEFSVLQCYCTGTREVPFYVLFLVSSETTGEPRAALNLIILVQKQGQYGHCFCLTVVHLLSGKGPLEH